MNVFLTMSSFIFPLITFPYVSRILLPSGMGKVSFATSLIAYFNMFAQLGIPTYGVRACAKVRDNRVELTRTTHELLFINLVMSMVSYIVLFIAIMFIPRLREERTLYVIVSATILLSTIGMEWLYKALEQYKYITVRSIFFKIVALVAMFLLIHQEKDYVIYGGISILAASASNILNLFNAKKYIYWKPTGKYNLSRHYKAIAIFFFMSCATTVYTNLDTVMLGFIVTDADVGYYNAAVKIKMILISIVASLGTVLLPRASYYIEHNLINKFYRINEKAISFVFLVASPLMIYFILFAKEGIYLLSGEAYSDAIHPMQIVMPTLLFVGLTNILGIQILVPMGKEKYVLYSEVAGAIVDIICNFILIPYYGVVGAAVSNLVAEAVVLLVQYLALKNEITDAFRKVQYGKICLALLLGMIACYWVPGLQMDNLVILVISACLFFGTYGMTLFVLKEPLFQETMIQFFKKLVNKNKVV